MINFFEKIVLLAREISVITQEEVDDLIDWTSGTIEIIHQIRREAADLNKLNTCKTGKFLFDFRSLLLDVETYFYNMRILIEKITDNFYCNSPKQSKIEASFSQDKIDTIFCSELTEIEIFLSMIGNNHSFLNQGYFSKAEFEEAIKKVTLIKNSIHDCNTILDTIIFEDYDKLVQSLPLIQSQLLFCEINVRFLINFIENITNKIDFSDCDQ